MSGFNICGLVVRSKDSRVDEVRDSLSALPGVEIHAEETGRMVVTVENDDPGTVYDTVQHIPFIDGVVSTSLVYQYSDQLDTQQESAS